MEWWSMAADLSTLQYSKDAQGEDQLVSGEGWQVMMAWEKPYMEACVDALGLGPTSDVLEIGFGMGYSSDRIQSYGVRSHTIIECSPEVLARLRRWKAGSSAFGGVAQESDGCRDSDATAAGGGSGDSTGGGGGDGGGSGGGCGVERSNVRIVEGLWQLMLPTLGKFDAVFMDDYPVGLDTFKEELKRRFPEYANVYLDAPTKWDAFVDICLNWHLRPGGRIGGYMIHPTYPKREDCVAYMFPYKAEISKVRPRSHGSDA
jgi:hypothetical protein